jgi:hypothetical protein
VKTLVLAIAALALAVSLAQAAALLDAAYCRLWPHSEACRPPLPTPRPQTAPGAPAASPAPAVAPTIAHPPLRARPMPKQVKTKTVRPKRKAALPEWCDRIPATASLGQVEAAAPIFIGRRLTPAERQQAVACIASKKEKTT